MIQAKIALQAISAVILTPAYREFPGRYHISTDVPKNWISLRTVISLCISVVYQAIIPSGLRAILALALR